MMFYNLYGTQIMNQKFHKQDHMPQRNTISSLTPLMSSFTAREDVIDLTGVTGGLSVNIKHDCTRKFYMVQKINEAKKCLRDLREDDAGCPQCFTNQTNFLGNKIERLRCKKNESY